jgi:high-affinity iron transporter
LELTAARTRRLAWWAVGLAALAGLVTLAVTASGGSPDPTALPARTGRTTVVVDSAIIVFREGLEAVLIFAAVTASFMGAQKRFKKPMAMGALVALGAAVATFFAFQAILSVFSAKYGPQVQAITGLIAVLVLLVIMNWFLHNVYWTGWISKHHKRRRHLLRAGEAGLISAQVLGFVALGFTTVYREGFEVALFLQALELKSGALVVLEGTLIGLAATAVVGVLTFIAHRKLPYKKMLVLTGVMIGVVLVVMIGGTARSFQDLGWLPGNAHDLGIALPGWLARWFEVVPSIETLSVQAGAAVLVIGSYFVAKHVKVRKPRRAGEAPAVRPEAPAAPSPSLAA